MPFQTRLWSKVVHCTGNQSHPCIGPREDDEIYIGGATVTYNFKRSWMGTLQPSFSQIQPFVLFSTLGWLLLDIQSKIIATEYSIEGYNRYTFESIAKHTYRVDAVVPVQVLLVALLECC